MRVNEIPGDLDHTETVQAESSVIKEVTDVTRFWRHGAEGVSAAGSKGVQADQKHVDQQRPGVALRHEVYGGAQHAESPQEVPAGAQITLLKVIINSSKAEKQDTSFGTKERSHV